MRGGEMAMIFQDPINSFNPSWTIGSQFRRVLACTAPTSSAASTTPRSSACSRASASTAGEN